MIPNVQVVEVDNICLHSLTVASDLIVPFKKYSRYTPCFELMSYFVHGITHVTLKLDHVRKPIIVWLVCAYLFFFPSLAGLEFDD